MNQPQVRMPPTGFATVVTIEILSVNQSEAQEILGIFERSGYKLRFYVAPDRADADGVFGGRWQYTRDAPTHLVVNAAAPPAQAEQQATDDGSRVDQAEVVEAEPNHELADTQTPEIT